MYIAKRRARRSLAYDTKSRGFFGILCSPLVCLSGGPAHEKNPKQRDRGEQGNREACCYECPTPPFNQHVVSTFLFSRISPWYLPFATVLFCRSGNAGVILYRREPLPHLVRERDPRGPHDGPAARDVQDDGRPAQGKNTSCCRSIV